MIKAESYLNIGYQKILTFERPGGGFDWWGSGPALVWLTAYGVQQLNALSKVHEIDTGVIDRAHNFLKSKQDSDGSWGVVGGTHGETISHVENPRFALTAYVVWSLVKAGYGEQTSASKGIHYLKQNASQAKENPYLLALAANAILSANPKDETGLNLVSELENSKSEKEDMVYWKTSGKTASCAYGSAADVEVTALVILAMMESKQYTNTVNKAIQYLVKSRNSYGTWGSTQSTILALQCLISAEFLKTQGGDAAITVWINDNKAATWNINDDNRDVMQIVDLQNYTQVGNNDVRLEVTGNPNVMYQITTRHYVPWTSLEKPQEVPAIQMDIDYDRVTLAKNDVIIANATMRYNGQEPTYMVIIDLGIPPGFSVDQGDFAELIGEGVVQRYSVTGAQVTLYLGDVKPGDAFKFRYGLKAKYPLKAKTPKSTAYEYYSPQVRGESQPVELEVKE